ncbi:hypothetical protein DM02DRAFT_616460 [Periconia macrospinosa]|uniref:N-acetyltransferase domain-containing protein n=1 Tax=Periconia macrospinosa TaxID=97972 RepID=A0A2V1DHP7_9PLEO|nr:hypothetical protein DM02DRAFT_616460 [Periconia macrospinosa]
MSTTFHIRLASLAAKDNERFLAFVDSQLPWLESVGSGGQWGSTPRGNVEASQKKAFTRVQKSEACEGKPYSSYWGRAYVLEAEVDVDSLSDEVKQLSGPPNENGRVRVPVAGMVLESTSADYVRSILPEIDEKSPFLYLFFLASDRRTSSINKGSGAFLINHAKEEATRLGIRRIAGDCWTGNGRKLVQFYESQGFKSIEDFEAGDQKWPGTVFEMRI